MRLTQMHKYVKTQIYASGVALMLVLPSSAQAGVPTTDGAAVLKLSVLVSQQLKDLGIQSDHLDNFIQQLKVARNRYELAQQEFEAITGARPDIAKMLPVDVTKAKIAPDMASLRSANNVSDDIAERYNQVETAFEMIDGNSRYQDKGTSTREAIYDLEQASVKTELVVSETMFEEAGAAIDRYSSYRQTLADNDKNKDLKAAVDLNTRVLIENGENMARLMQLLSAQGQSAAIERATAIRRQSRNAIALK